jgi:hypothetical protein
MIGRWSPFLQRRVALTPSNPDPLGEAFLEGLRIWVKVLRRGANSLQNTNIAHSCHGKRPLLFSLRAEPHNTVSRSAPVFLTNVPERVWHNRSEFRDCRIRLSIGELDLSLAFNRASNQFRLVAFG